MAAGCYAPTERLSSSSVVPSQRKKAPQNGASGRGTSALRSMLIAGKTCSPTICSVAIVSHACVMPKPFHNGSIAGAHTPGVNRP